LQVPIGAVIVHDGRVVAEARNATEETVRARIQDALAVWSWRAVELVVLARAGSLAMGASVNPRKMSSGAKRAF